LVRKGGSEKKRGRSRRVRYWFWAGEGSWEESTGRYPEKEDRRRGGSGGSPLVLGVGVGGRRNAILTGHYLAGARAIVGGEGNSSRRGAVCTRGEKKVGKSGTKVPVLPYTAEGPETDFKGRCKRAGEKGQMRKVVQLNLSSSS